MIKQDPEITILIADDDEDDRDFINDAFATIGSFCRLQFVENGLAVMDYLLHKDRFSDATFYKTPDLILLDLSMPLQDGFETLIAIRNNHIFIPVITLSNCAADDTIIKAYELGANAFVSKPQSFENILKFIEAIQHFWFNFAEYPRNYKIMSPTY